VFTPVLAKHTKHLSLVDILSVGVDRVQRNFEPMRKQVETWKGTRLLDDIAKLVVYRAFIEGEFDVPNISPAASTIYISIRESRNSLRGQHGASPMRSPARSKTSTRFLNSRPLRSSHRSLSWLPLP
jgi:hypothetical protein